jgi:hypothetical protein
MEHYEKYERERDFGKEIWRICLCRYIETWIHRRVLTKAMEKHING